MDDIILTRDDDNAEIAMLKAHLDRIFSIKDLGRHIFFLDWKLVITIKVSFLHKPSSQRNF